MAKRARRGGKGGGCLVLRGKTWFARWVRTVDGQAQVFTRTTETSSRREAEAKLAEFTAPFRLRNETETLKAMAAKIDGAEAEIQRFEESQPTMTMLHAWETFKVAPKGKTPRGRKINPGVRTLTDYEGRWNAFIQWLDKNHPTPKDATGSPIPRELRSVTPEQAQKYIAGVKGSRSGNTSNKTLTFLRMVFTVLNEQARIKQNPFEGMESDTVSVERKRPLTVEELATVSKMLAGSGEMELLFSLGYYTGGRLGDIMRLRWDNIDLAARKIHYTPHKTAKTKAGRDGVTHGVPPPLFALLDKTPKKDRRGLVLKEMGGVYPENPAAVCKQIQKVFTDAGIETGAAVEGYGKKVARVGFHSLRHSYITALLERGIPADSVRRMAGHADISMTMHYFHTSGDALQSISNAIPDIGTSKTLPEPENAVAGILNALPGLSDAELEAVADRARELAESRKARKQ